MNQQHNHDSYPKGMERSCGVIGERGQVVIPKTMRTQLGLAPRDKVEFILERGRLTLRRKRDLGSVRATIKRFGGTARAQMLAEGYRSTDDWIEGTRGR